MALGREQQGSREQQGKGEHQSSWRRGATEPNRMPRTPCSATAHQFRARAALMASCIRAHLQTMAKGRIKGQIAAGRWAHVHDASLSAIRSKLLVWKTRRLRRWNHLLSWPPDHPGWLGLARYWLAAGCPGSGCAGSA